MELYNKNPKNLNWLQVTVCSHHQHAQQDYDAHVLTLLNLIEQICWLQYAVIKIIHERDTWSQFNLKNSDWSLREQKKITLFITWWTYMHYCH